MQETGARRPRRVVWLLIAGVALAALNLRTAITSVGPVLGEVTAGLHMSAALAGVLTTLPVLCFAVFGALTPALARRFGEHPMLAAALLAIAVGVGTRPLADDPWLFLALSTIALAGGAIGNVLLPTLVKQHFPDRVGALTTVYTTFLALGSTLAAAGTVPIEQAGGDWRVALGVYALFALVAAVPWLLVLRHGPQRSGSARALGLGQVLRTATGRWSVLFFGTQCTIAYILFGWYAEMLRDSGMSAATAGLALSYLTGLSIPLSMVLPGLMARTRDHRGFVVMFFGSYVIGVAGLWVAPIQGVWLWTTFIGVGMATFTLALTFFAVRTRTAAGTAAMSATSQSIGYLMGGLGPFLFGLLREVTGGWHAPLALFLALVVLNLAAGLRLGRPGHLEDELGPGAAAGAVSPEASRPAR
ncbi:CynX/NimT family MFS transporter [Nocardiopsis sediminis]|uniref:CynX/NimT family MFS transporter n=1 Tax=Nocardiopsis sediminis TaxID=1778267 RepID=A0ABV8FNX5_9ACTN